MNELVKKSIWLNNYYTQPSCTPSRSTIMSGKWVHKTGYQNMEVQYSYPVGMPLSHKLLPKHLQVTRGLPALQRPLLNLQWRILYPNGGWKAVVSRLP